MIKNEITKIIKHFIQPTDKIVIDEVAANNVGLEFSSKKGTTKFNLQFTNKVFKIKINKLDINKEVARMLAKQLAEDLKKFDDPNPEARACDYLQSTTRRVISRYLAKKLCQNEIFWNVVIRKVDDASNLSYEGKNSRPSIIFLKDTSLLSENNIKKFAVKINLLESDLLEETWVRAVVEGERTAFFSESDDGSIDGILSLVDVVNSEIEIPEKQEGTAAPHISLLQIQNLLQDSGIAIHTSKTGDIFIMVGKEQAFQKSGGYWRFYDYKKILKTVKTKINSYSGLFYAIEIEENSLVLRNLIRSCIDLSYERQGALFWLLDKKLIDVIDDTVTLPGNNDNSPHKNLLSALKGANITEWSTRNIMNAAAAVDGAVVINASGKIIDVGHTVTEIEIYNKKTRPKIILTDDQKKEYEDLPGKKSKAAYRGSFLGLTIKVSEDGPISMYLKGNLIASYG
jgi:hypothetical protein